MTDAYYITAKELSELELKKIPDELKSSAHMIYSSPATLDFNSPGAKGFGVKRAALAVPGSVMLLVAPGCCGRNTALLNELGYSERFFYLLLDDTDIVTGRHLKKIPQAVGEILEELEQKPSAVMICITCVDALLGTDMERVCKKCELEHGVPTVPAYMYALTREKRLHPMAAVRKSVYSLLEKRKRNSAVCNILGFFSPLYDSCELYTLLKEAGIKRINEISRCKDFDRYLQLAEANFNLVLNSEARHAAQDMQERLGIPFIELTRVYDPDKIKTQYIGLNTVLGTSFGYEKYYETAIKEAEDFKTRYEGASVAIGECLNADSIELALTLIKYGINVKELYTTVGEGNYPFLKRLAALSPDTRIYSNLSPTMLAYKRNTHLDAVIGVDAMYYHSGIKGIQFNTEEQPFGFDGFRKLISELGGVLS